jgi:hypothetical protein
MEDDDKKSEDEKKNCDTPYCTVEEKLLLYKVYVA